MTNLGWIKVHRKLLDWEWWDDTKTLWVFMKCLLLANHEDASWHGVIIKKGSFISSYEHLSSKKAHISVQQVRTAIKHLKSTGELTIKTTNKYSVITIQNWNEYQSNNKQTPADQQATNKQITTNNNDNNVKNDKNDVVEPPKRSNPLVLSRSQLMAFSKQFNGLTTDQIKQQEQSCNSYMGMSSTTYSNPGLFFRKWLERYYQEWKKEQSQKRLYETPHEEKPVDEESLTLNLKRMATLRSTFQNKLRLKRIGGE